VIFGMDWLSKHNGLIDCVKKVVKLTPKSGKELEYVVENLVTNKAASNIIVLNHLDAVLTLDIRTVSEFLNVFPEELLGMLPDHEIEFAIELVLGTTPIFKRPYRMDANQLSLRNNFRSYYIRGISALLHHHGEHLLFLYRRRMVHREYALNTIL
jgi:hypothetical protein